MTLILDALGETGPFDGFDEADFDAFERKKWGSRVYTMARRAGLQKLVALLRGIIDERADKVGDHELGASDDAPSIANNRKVEAVWAYLTRPGSLRSALSSRLSKTDLADSASLFDIAVEHQHASLILRLDQAGVSAEVHFSPKATVDRMNAERKLSYQDDQKALLALIAELPPEVNVGFEDGLSPAPEATEATLESWADRWNGGGPAFVVRRNWDRHDARLSEPGFVDEAIATFDGLWDIYLLMAWSRDNDFAKVGVTETLAKVEKRLNKTGAAVSEAKSEVALAPGTRVTILSGLFAGRAGYLAEVDGKGKVKVMVGPVSVSVPIGDVKLS